jgi:hypothetical protein
VNIALDEPAIRAFLLGKEAYLDTDFIVFRSGADTAVVAVTKAEDPRRELFSRIVAVEVIGLPPSTRWADDATVDTGNPSALGRKALALGLAPSETLVVRGLYEHVNFIHRPRPLAIDVFDLSPPDPPRLLDLARRVLAYRDLAPVALHPRIQSIAELATRAGDRPILFPCEVTELNRLPISYLDQRPARRDWVMVGCERSAQIHRHFYGDDAPRIELCPQKLFEHIERPSLMRCCLIEGGYQLSGQLALVPWGAQLSHVEGALEALIASARDPSEQR